MLKYNTTKLPKLPCVLLLNNNKHSTNFVIILTNTYILSKRKALSKLWVLIIIIIIINNFLNLKFVEKEQEKKGENSFLYFLKNHQKNKKRNINNLCFSNEKIILQSIRISEVFNNLNGMMQKVQNHQTYKISFKVKKRIFLNQEEMQQILVKKSIHIIRKKQAKVTLI